jgi:tetratricopeptide (TPR) repeat protein
MSYTVREVSAMLGLSETQIRAYAAKGVLKPERGARGELRFGFEDLVILRTAGELAEQVPERRVRKVLRRLREQLPDEKSLTGVRLAADGEQVVVREGESVWNAESGQKLFDFEVSRSRGRGVSQCETPVAAAVRIAEAPRDPETPQLRDPSAEEWFELALDLELTTPEEARGAYERALSIDPNHVDAHVNLGRILHEEGAPLAAEKHYRAALAIEPDHAVAVFNLGVALEDLGRPAEARRMYETSLALDPNNADAHYNLAGIYERRGDKAAAVRHLKACKSLQGRT